MTLFVASTAPNAFGQPTHFYFEALHNHITSSPSSRRSNKRVSLVRRPSKPIKFLSSPMIITDAAVAAQTEKKKKSVRFSETVEQVRLFYQWEAPHRQQLPIAEKGGDVPPATLPPSKLQFALEPVAVAGAPQHNNRSGPIQLERIAVTSDQAVTGQCRVVNLAFEKHVMARYSFDNWVTFCDADAIFRESCASSDLFDFEIPLSSNGSSSIQAKELQLSLRYCVNGFEFWDNNNGQNYRYQIIHHTKSTRTMSTKSKRTSPLPMLTHRAASAPVDLISYQYFYPLFRERIA